MSDAPQPPSERDEDSVPFRTKPLSKNATKVLVVVIVVLSLATAIAGAYMLTQVAEESNSEEPTPTDTIQPESNVRAGITLQ